MKTLSDKIETNSDEVMEEYEMQECYRDWIFAEDVKESIKELKNIFDDECRHDTPYHHCKHIVNTINKIFGDKLT